MLFFQAISSLPFPLVSEKILRDWQLKQCRNGEGQGRENQGQVFMTGDCCSKDVVASKPSGVPRLLC